MAQANSVNKVMPSGVIVGTTDVQTLTQKTLTTPIIGDLTNATHDHSNNAGGATLNASVIAAGTLKHEQGGLEADVSAYSGLLKITGGATSQVTAPTGTIVGTTDSQTLTTKTIDAASNTISNLATSMFAANVIDTDTALAADSDTRIASQKATKAYVDAVAVGLSWKNSVVVATDVAKTLISDFEDGDTIDGIQLSTGDRILIKNQTGGNEKENGIYVVKASGAPDRAEDADTEEELISAAVFVQSGTEGEDTAWVCTNDAITLETTAIVFAQFSGTGTYSAGNGLSLSTGSFSINTAITVDKTTAQTLTNKTLTTPIIAQINDANDNEMIVMNATGSAVNFLDVTNSATGNGVGLGATGTDTDVDLLLTAKGAGVVKADGVQVATISDTQTLTNKTLTTPTIGDFTNATHDHSNNAGGGTFAIGNTTGTLGETRGGTGLTTYTSGDILYSDGSNSLAKLAKGSDGQVLKLASGVPSWSNDVGTEWAEKTAAFTMVIDGGYIANHASVRVALTLPATAAVGSVIEIVGKGAAGWSILQAASQQIHFGNVDSTSGTGGKLESSAQYDVVRLVCITADTDWVITSSIGLITVT